MTSTSRTASLALNMHDAIEQVFVKPARPGLVMFDPTSRVRLPDEGMLVPRDTYWRRRIRSGDAVVATPPSASAKAIALKNQAPKEL